MINQHGVSQAVACAMKGRRTAKGVERVGSLGNLAEEVHLSRGMKDVRATAGLPEATSRGNSKCKGPGVESPGDNPSHSRLCLTEETQGDWAGQRAPSPCGRGCWSVQEGSLEDPLS